jgi:VIT1/CCC1 family predicted Fe2+/Mn2+ transporter
MHEVEPFSAHPHEAQHRDIQGGGARAAVFGISDGLVTNVSLILGLSAGHPGGGVVRLAGIAGLLAGAFSMAAGEYVSMRAQTELIERELEVERKSIHLSPVDEQRELAQIYMARGLDRELAEVVAEKLMSNPEQALETHAREELGINPSSFGRPMQAALASFVTFSIGAAIPLVPFLITSGTVAVIWAVVLTSIASLIVGGALSIFTGKSWWWSAMRQLLICAAAGAVTYGVGTAIGTSTGA